MKSIQFLFLVFYVVAAQISVTILPDGNTLSAPPPVIRTYTAQLAPGSKKWLQIVQDVSRDFPEFDFQSEVVDMDDLTPGKTHSFPYTELEKNGKRYRFNYNMNERYFRRWVSDARYGYFSLFKNVSVLDSNMPKAHPIFVHVLSAEKPSSYFAKVLPEVGFSWSFANQTNVKDTVIVRGMDGIIRQKQNISEYSLLHYILPPIIPYWMIESDTGYAIYRVYAVRVVEIVYDDTLPEWWESTVHEFPQTAFIQLRYNETNTSKPSVWFKRRSVLFVKDSVGAEVKEWLRGIPRHLTEPTYRPSAGPETAHSFLTDVTGDSFWDWIKNDTVKVLHLYNQTDEYDLEHVFEDLCARNVSVGRMDMSKNDHEYLPLDAGPGMCLHFTNKSVLAMKRCEEFDFTLQ